MAPERETNVKRFMLYCGFAETQNVAKCDCKVRG